MNRAPNKLWTALDLLPDEDTWTRGYLWRPGLGFVRPSRCLIGALLGVNEKRDLDSGLIDQVNNDPDCAALANVIYDYEGWNDDPETAFVHELDDVCDIIWNWNDDLATFAGVRTVLEKAAIARDETGC